MVIFKNKISLHFKNETIDQKYYRDSLDENLKCVQYNMGVIWFYITLSILEMIYFNYNDGGFHKITRALDLLLCFLIEYTRRKIQNNISMHLVSLFICLETLFSLEMYFYNSYSKEQQEVLGKDDHQYCDFKILFLANKLAFYYLIALITNIYSWYYQLVVVIFPVFYISSRFPVKLEEFAFLMPLFILGFSLYFKEQISKINFFVEYQREQSKKTILENIPCGVIIISKKPTEKETQLNLQGGTQEPWQNYQLRFTNGNTKKFITSSDEEKFLEELFQMQIETYQQDHSQESRHMNLVHHRLKEKIHKFYNQDHQSRSYQVIKTVEKQSIFTDVTLSRVMWSSSNTTLQLVDLDNIENVNELMITLSDVTQSVDNAQLKELDQYQDRLLATVTHDIKTPLSNSISFLKQAIEQKDPDLSKSLVIKCLKSSNLLVYLLHDILDFSQLHVKKLRIVKSKFNLIDIVNEVIDLFCYTAESKRVTIQLMFPDILKKDTWTIESDEMRIKQILINLLSNALQFSFDTEIIIKVNLVYLAENNLEDSNDLFHLEIAKSMSELQNVTLQQYNKFFSLTIEDHGLGMGQDIKNNLFQQYNTFDNAMGGSQNSRGVGLGLTITKELIKILGPKSDDHIIVDSQERVGTSFTFLLQRSIDQYWDQRPSIGSLEKLIHSNYFQLNRVEIRQFKEKFCISQIEIQDWDLHSNHVQDSENFKADLMMEKELQIILNQNSFILKDENLILLVDDDIFNVECFRMFLNDNFKGKFKLEECFNGLTAQNLVKENYLKQKLKYKAVFLDNHMPGKNGTEVGQALRQFFSTQTMFNGHKPPQIILYSGDIYSGDEEVLFYQGDNEKLPIFDHILSKPITDSSVIQKILF